MGDGALRFRDSSSRPASPSRRALGAALRERREPSASSGARRAPASLDELVPDYRRRPDAELALTGRGDSEQVSPDDRATPASTQRIVPDIGPGRGPVEQAAGRGDPAAQLPGSAAGDRDRAPRVPHAVVAGDVRAGALQAVGHLPGGGVASERARRLSDLLALRHRVARDERGRRQRPPAPGPRLGAAGRAVRARRRQPGALHARGAPLQQRRHPPVRTRGLPRGGHAPALLPGQRRGRARDVAHAGDARGLAGRRAQPRGWTGRSDDPRARDQLRRHVRGGARRRRARCART